jgi:hypothetical protein
MRQILRSCGSTYRALILLLSLLAGSRLSQAQAPAWQTAVGFGSNPSVQASAADASGNIYLTGSFTGTVSLGTTTLTSAGSNDLFVAKWSTATNSFAWAQRAGGIGNDASYGGIAVNGSSIYVINSFSGPSITVGSATLPGNDNLYGYVLKFTDAGSSSSFTWAQLIKGVDPTNEAVYASAIAVSGTSVYVSGDAGGFNASNAITFGSIVLPLSEGDDAFVAKLTDAGSSSSFVWARRAGGTAFDDAAFFTQMVVQGNSVYLGGLFAGSATFGSTTLTTDSNSNFDIMVAKLTDAGTTASFTWVQRGTSPGTDYVNRMAVSGTNVYVAGYLSGATLTFGNTVLTNAGAAPTLDGYVAKFIDGGSTGSLGWAQRIGSTSTENIRGLAATGNTVYLAGSFGGTVAFGTSSLTSAGSNDVFVAKLNDAGSSAAFSWAQQAGGTGSDIASVLGLSGTTLYTVGTVVPPASFGSLTIAAPAATTTGFIATLAGNALSTKAGRTGQNPLTIYPNPAREKVLVQLPAHTTTLLLTDARGRQVRAYSFRPGTAEASLDLRGLAPGLYLLRTATAGQKLIVE